MRWRIFAVSWRAISASVIMDSLLILSSWPSNISNLELLGTLGTQTHTQTNTNIYTNVDDFAPLKVKLYQGLWN